MFTAGTRPDDYGINGVETRGHEICQGSSGAESLVEAVSGSAEIAMVLDVPGRSVAGHHLLDLNRIYGLT
jgi:hypothetical protein